MRRLTRNSCDSTRRAQTLAESAVTFSEHNDQTRQRFLAILGHDLRTPLSAVRMIAHLLMRSKSVE